MQLEMIIATTEDAMDVLPLIPDNPKVALDRAFDEAHDAVLGHFLLDNGKAKVCEDDPLTKEVPSAEDAFVTKDLFGAVAHTRHFLRRRSGCHG